MSKVYGVGINDMKGKWRCGKKTSNHLTTQEEYEVRVYKLWKNMLKRCYSSKCHQVQPTYLGVVVCDEWLIFSNFIKDLPNLPNYQLWLNNPNQRIALDKEFNGPSRIYSPQTCGFNTQQDNSREMQGRCQPGLKLSRKVEGTSLRDGSKIYFDSAMDAERLGGFTHSHVSKCCRGERKSHKNYTWRYV